MHVSWSYELKRNRTAFSVFLFYIYFFPLFFSFINEMFRCHVFWVNLVCVCPREVRMNEVWRSVRAALALQLERKHLISTHVIMFFYIYCVRCWNVLIYKAVNTWKWCSLFVYFSFKTRTAASTITAVSKTLKNSSHALNLAFLYVLLHVIWSDAGVLSLKRLKEDQNKHV